MPVYVYRCESCGREFEKRQSFADKPLTECELCSGRVYKVLQPIPIIYKGSGFYTTDYGSKSGGNGRNGRPDKVESKKTGAESLDSKKRSDTADAD